MTIRTFIEYINHNIIYYDSSLLFRAFYNLTCSCQIYNSENLFGALHMSLYTFTTAYKSYARRICTDLIPNFCRHLVSQNDNYNLWNNFVRKRQGLHVILIIEQRNTVSVLFYFPDKYALEHTYKKCWF